MGYSADLIDYFTDVEKESFIRDEYLYHLNQDYEDCVIFVEDMAEYIINHYKGDNDKDNVS
jgi:hypothetical protein